MYAFDLILGLNSGAVPRMGLLLGLAFFLVFSYV